ncbi:MAG: hypothetical protein QGD90_04850 [Candidatus Hydrogenedentes bacterium]|nr:hypothetical protein [Candidatus Hydrogenedentota bacterium]
MERRAGGGRFGIKDYPVSGWYTGDVAKMHDRNWVTRFMTESFREPGKAASYVSSGLSHDFPDATVEIIRLAGHGRKQRVCETKDIDEVLKEMCRGSGPSRVDYHPNNAYGFVAQIDCGDGNGPLSRVFVILTEVKGRPIAVGSRPSVRQAFELD